MTQIIIVGHPQSGLESTEQLLANAGMAAAQPSRRDHLRAQEINGMLIKAHGAVPIEQLQTADPLQQIDVAPVWQGMVLDLMLGNLDHRLWGWTDPQAVYLLDYWKNLDPKIVFALAYDAPHTALTRLSLTEAAAPEQELQRRLDAWVAVNSALLNFHLRNPTRSVLVHTQQVQTLATRTLQHLSERIAAPLELSALEPSPPVLATAVDSDTATTLLDDAQIEVFASLLIQANPQAQTLYAELQAASTLAVNTPQQTLLSLADTDNTQILYRAWQACVTQQQRIQQLNQRVLDATTQSARLQASVEHTQKRLDGAWQHAQTREADHARALQAAQHAAQTQLQARDQQLQKQNQQLHERDQQLATAQQQAQHVAQENDLLLNQLQQVQEELARQQQEHSAALTAVKVDLQSKVKQLTDAQAKLKQQEQAAQNAQQALKQQEQKTCQEQKTQQQAAQKANSQITELQQESELLLNQLHKVQEELERYYLENQTLKVNQKPKTSTYYGAADRIKNELPYRLGACLIKQSRSLGGWLALPFALRAEVKRLRQSAASDARQTLPPIDQYSDAHEAERVKQHLSYRLGACMLAKSKTPGGWLSLPWALYVESKAFRQARENKAA